VRRECVDGDEHAVHNPDDNANLSANSRKQIRLGLGLRTPREMANIGNFENIAFHPLQPLEKIMAKKKPGKADTSIRVIKETLTKSALINLIAEQNDIPRKTAIGVFNTLESVMLGSVHPRGVGEFTLPGLCKITLRKVPARKAGTLIRNPATGEMMKGAAKPASVRVRIRALSKLKGAAIS
jgi:nucleoid DNA-binding protein